MNYELSYNIRQRREKIGMTKKALSIAIGNVPG